MTKKRINQIEALFAESPGILRSSAMRKQGICSKDLKELEDSGLITRLKDGYYAWSSVLDDLSDSFIATATIPDATIYGISAAAQYNLTTVIPDAVHIKVPNRGRMPQAPLYPPVEITQEKMPAFSLGRICEKTNRRSTTENEPYATASSINLKSEQMLLLKSSGTIYAVLMTSRSFTAMRIP